MIRSGPHLEEFYNCNIKIAIEEAVHLTEDSYVDAREYIKLMSEGESAPETNKPLGKGRRKPKKRTFLSENCEDEEYEDLMNEITPPPTIKIPKQAIVYSEGNIACPPVLQNSSELKAHKKTIVRTVSSEFTETRISLPRLVATDIADYNHTIIPPVAAQSNCECKIEESAILKSILNNIITVKLMLEQLTSEEKSRTTNNNSVITNFELVPKKPFSKYKRLKEFDEAIKNDQTTERQNETALFLVGGATPKEMIRRSLRKLFSDKCDDNVGYKDF
ncbi:hypothetical protein FQR65_LT10038 [Abscondita terminalis]|nr:hypothetical protein FQR65_LT10038 [Abscondita terminalis]